MVVIVREQLHILCPFHIFFDKFQIFHVLQKALLLRQISGVGSMGFQKGYLNADGNARSFKSVDIRSFLLMGFNRKWETPRLMH